MIDIIFRLCAVEANDRINVLTGNRVLSIPASGPVVVIEIEPEQWQLLNDVHGGLLVYSTCHDAYFATRVSRWISKAAMSQLLQCGLIEQSGLLGGVYRLSSLGQTVWARMPGIAAEGRCDYCGRVREVRPHRQQEGSSPLFRFLCRPCGEMVGQTILVEAV